MRIGAQVEGEGVAEGSLLVEVRSIAEKCVGMSKAAFVHSFSSTVKFIA